MVAGSIAPVIRQATLRLQAKRNIAWPMDIGCAGRMTSCMIWRMRTESAHWRFIQACRCTTFCSAQYPALFRSSLLVYYFSLVVVDN